MSFRLGGTRRKVCILVCSQYSTVKQQALCFLYEALAGSVGVCKGLVRH